MLTTMRMRVIAAHHDGAHAGHRGVMATVERILAPGVREYIGKCQKTKAGNAKPLGKA